MSSQLFTELKESLQEAIEHSEGKRSLKTTSLPRPLKRMDSTDVVKIRESLQASQAVFAVFLNVSVRTVQGWEQGISKPSGAALKLLTLAQKNPKILEMA